jgi:polyhydroxyalkanoate synthase
VVLIVPAPIKRAYICDLAPDVSVVQQLARSNLSFYLAQWEDPGVSEQG